jgi:hypothetical protein
LASSITYFKKRRHFLLHRDNPSQKKNRTRQNTSLFCTNAAKFFAQIEISLFLPWIYLIFSIHLPVIDSSYHHFSL